MSDETNRNDICAGGMTACRNRVEYDDRYCADHDDDHRLAVNVYEITQHYGGAEEGGWWYDWRECVATVPAKDAQDVEVVIAFLKERYVSEGNIHSTRGGVEYHVLAEYEPAQSASKQTPHYE